MTIYLLNAPIVTDYGLWQFTGPLTIAETQAILAQKYTSAIGHEASAKLLSQCLNMPIPVSRIQITMLPGDQAIVLRLLQRLPEGKVLHEQALKALNYELGLLTRIK